MPRRDRFIFAATNLLDPLGDFGGQVVSIDCTCKPLVRFGNSLVFSMHAADTGGILPDETDFVRLRDGTRLTENGELAIGVTDSDFDIYFYGVDAAMKWRGWSVNAEAFFRWIEDVRGNAAPPLNDLFQHWFYVEGERFIIPQRIGWNLRNSQVNGKFGDRNEYAGGE